MGRWLKARLAEKSTARGGVLLTMLLGMYMGPVQADIAVQALMALWGVIEVVKSERGGGANAQAQ